MQKHQGASNVKPERAFQTEIDLVEHFKNNYAKIFLKEIERKVVRRFVLLKEFDCCNGVADIVLATLRPYARLKKRRQPVNVNWLLPLAQLPENQIIELDRYAAFCGVSNRTARKHLEHFKQAEFLECLDRRHYKVNKAYTPVLESAISLEAKLRDWRRALAQAYRYRSFSNYSFVLLPAATAESAVNNLELFRRHDVGLVTLGTKGLCVHHCPSRRERPLNDAFLRVNEAAHAVYCC